VGSGTYKLALNLEAIMSRTIVTFVASPSHCVAFLSIVYTEITRVNYSRGLSSD